MASAQGTWPAVLLLIVLFLVPPVVSLVSCVMRAGNLRDRPALPAWLLGAGSFSALALLVNLAVIGATIWNLGAEGPSLGSSHALAALLSWAAFWLWIAMIVFQRRRRRRKVY